MKKFLTTLFALVLIVAASNAQDIFNNPGKNKNFFGVRVNYELATPGDITTPGSPMKSALFGNGSGFSVEGVYNIPLWKNLYFQPGVGIYYNTYSIDKSSVEGLNTLESASARQWGFRLPLHVGYNFDFIPEVRIAFFTGPELNVSFKGRTHYGIDKYDVSGPLFGGDGYLNRTDVKWRFGVGATFATRYYFAVSGAVGMCDLARDYEDISIKLKQEMSSNLFDITFGYNF